MGAVGCPEHADIQKGRGNVIKVEGEGILVAHKVKPVDGLPGDLSLDAIDLDAGRGVLALDIRWLTSLCDEPIPVKLEVPLTGAAHRPAGAM